MLAEEPWVCVLKLVVPRGLAYATCTQCRATALAGLRSTGGPVGPAGDRDPGGRRPAKPIIAGHSPLRGPHVGPPAWPRPGAEPAAGDKTAGASGWGHKGRRLDRTMASVAARPPKSRAARCGPRRAWQRGHSGCGRRRRPCTFGSSLCSSMGSEGWMAGTGARRRLPQPGRLRATEPVGPAMEQAGPASCCPGA